MHNIPFYTTSAYKNIFVTICIYHSLFLKIKSCTHICYSVEVLKLKIMML